MGVDRASIYLPIILAAALAMATYWLVRNAPKLLEPTAKAAPTHEPDYFMRDFVIKNFLPNGDLRSELHGTEGRHYPDSDTMEVDTVRMRTWSTSMVSVSGYCRPSVPCSSLRRSPLGRKFLMTKSRMK